MTTKPHITPAAIYAARSIRGALPAERSRDFCEHECYAKSDLSICDGTTACWAKSIGASSHATASEIYAKRRLQLERGRTPAPRPRSLANNEPGGPR
jgi:hypothetical protein